MAQDLESLLKDIFGESFNRVSKFEGEQTKRVMTKIHDIAREALKDELARLQTEINELRARVAVLEAERIQASSDQV